MKDFKNFGLKRRFYPEHNYNALWCNLKTVRLGTGRAEELPANESEFYDVGINTKCNAECPFCYVSASGQGINYPNICETWKKWMDTFWEKQEDRILLTNKPFQIAIGSTGEPTIHPEFCDFLKTVYESGVKVENLVYEYFETENDLYILAWEKGNSYYAKKGTDVLVRIDATSKSSKVVAKNVKSFAFDQSTNSVFYVASEEEEFVLNKYDIENNQASVYDEQNQT